MKVSIITATYNSDKYIADCVASVNSQSYKNTEHIFIDGASIDRTLEIIKTTTKRSNKIISEPDQGIYDAMNKGIDIATGDIIGILNSDDYYDNDAILEEIVKVFTDNKVDSVYGNLDFVSPDNPLKVIRQWKSSAFIPGSFSSGWHPPHPTFFVKSEIYKKFGSFDTTLNVSADFELMLRFLEKEKISTFYLDETIVKMRYGGESTGSLKKIIEGNRNILYAFRKNGIKISPFYPLLRLLPKLKQFILK